jgi:hypothetical protein
MGDVSESRLVAAVRDLPPGDRALIDLWVRRGFHDRQLAALLGTEVGEIRRRRGKIIETIGAELGVTSPAELAEVRAALERLPAEQLAEDDVTGVGAGEEGELGEGDRGEARERAEKRSFLRDNSLSIFFLVLFFGAVVGQAIAGHDLFNEEESQHGGGAISLSRYLVSSSFGQAVLENWQSEFLQFSLYILATIYFLQRGSPESKEPHKAGRESDEDQRLGRHSQPDSPRWARVGGIRTAIYRNSLLIAMGLVFIASWAGHAVTGWSDYNADQLDHDGEKVSFLDFVQTPTFWESTFQNWQSEFLAVGAMAVFSIYLRQRGSAESKPVGAPHHATGVEG